MSRPRPSAPGSQHRAHTRPSVPLAPVDAPRQEAMRLGVADLREGLRRWPVWWLLALRAVTAQYRRTVLGPWWVTIQMAVFILGLSLLFGILLGEPLDSFLPYVGVGYICFSLITSTISTGAGVFVAGAALVKGSNAPLSSVVYRSVTVCLVQFAHDLVLYVPIVLVCRVPLSPAALLAVPVAAAILLGGVGVGLWLGPLGARFRDVGPLVAAIMRLLFFVTPVFWSTAALTAGQRAALSAWNPLAYLLAAFRDPLIGAPLHPASYAVTAVWAVANLVAGVVAFSLTRSRLAYWV